MVTSFLNRFAPINFTRYIDRLTDRFTGREWLFEQIDQWLQEQNSQQFYLLTGEPGIGKSAIVAELIKRWQSQPNSEEQGKLAAYHFCRAGDVETVRPGRVLRSIAAQLGKTLPHYGEALQATIDPICLQINVNIDIGSLSNSQVTGIYIENLKEGDPREELEILLRRPLAALPSLHPELYEDEGETPAPLKVFLIDSLDEAVTTTGRDNMATLMATLSQVDGLPTWVRFILTARPSLQVLQQFELLKRYQLEELLAQNLHDIERYVQRRVVEFVEQPEVKFQERLEQAELSGEMLVGKVKDLSQGNFLYTCLVMDGIGTGELSLKNLSALPRTLNEVYQRFLRHRCPFRKWLHLYQPILGTLTVTQEAISRDRLVRFTGIDVEKIEAAVGVVQQFLDEVEDEQGQKLYAIFHQSLRDYLLDRKHNHDFWCDAREQHENIISCYEQGSETWQELQQIDLYGLRHLAQHLVQADQVEQLHRLLNLERSGRNAWFAAKDAVAETEGFLADLELAWAKADEAYQQKPEKSIGLQCRYALIRASINSLAEIPTELIVVIIKHHYWKPTKVLAYIQRIPNAQKKFESLIALVDQLPDSSPLRPQALQIALQTVEQIRDKDDRLQSLTVLASKMPDAQSKALEAVQLIHNDYARAKTITALINLINHLPCELLPKALEVAQTIQNANARSEVLTALSSKLPEALPEALEAIQALENDFSRADALITLADKLTPNLLPKAWEVAQTIQDRLYFVKALIALSDKLPEALSRALEAAKSIQDPSSRAKALTALGDKLPEALTMALEAAELIQDVPSRAQALTRLGERLPEALTMALEAAQSIQDDFYLVTALIALSAKMPEVLPKALEVAEGTQHEFRAHLLTSLAKKLPEALPKALDEGLSDATIELLDIVTPDLLPKALEAAQAVWHEHYRVKALTALVDKMPEALPKLLDAIQSIYSDEDRIQALTVLADKLPETLPIAVEAAQTIEDSSSHADALVALADKLPNSLEVAQNIQDSYDRAKALILRAHRIPEVLPEALEAIQALENDFSRADALITLADKLTPNLLPKAWEVAQTIQDRLYYVKALIALSDKLPEALSRVLEAAKSIQDPSSRAKALTALGDKLPEAVFEALASTQAIQYEPSRAEALIALSSKLDPNLLPKALEISHTVQDTFSYIQVLTHLGEKFPEVFPKALEVAQTIQDPSQRAQTLTALGQKCPEAFPKALEAAQAIQDREYRVHVLALLADELPEALAKALEEARVIQRDYYRAEALIVLVDKIPEILPEVLETVQAIQSNSSRASALAELAHKLTPKFIPKALEIAQTTQDEYSKYRGRGSYSHTRVLTALANRAPEILPKAIEATQAVEDDFQRANFLATLASSLSTYSDCFSIWKDLLHFLSYRNRASLLRDIKSLISVLEALGGESAIAETVQAIQDVTRWWT